MKIVFMGTPDFAARVLENLIINKFNIVAVVSQKDKKVGRSQVVEETPTKKIANKYNIDVLQPSKLKEEYQEILNYEPDLIITCAYGQFVNKEILDYPKYKCINIHPSLLPKYRGGAPIHWAIMNGETKTAVSIIEMVQKMDAGDILFQQELDIDKDDTYSSLEDKLINLVNDILPNFINSYIAGNYTRIIQNDDEVVFGLNVKSEEEFVSFKADVNKVYNHIRGLIDKPVSYGMIDNKRIKFYEAKMEEIKHNYVSGQLIDFSDGMRVACDNGIIKIYKLQKEGKKLQDFKEFKNGNQNLIGKIFE